MKTKSSIVQWVAALLVAFSLGVASAQAAGDIKQVQLLIQKLRDSMASLKELDELEKAGMPKRDVDRMRRALQKKIQEMIDETVQSIQEL